MLFILFIYFVIKGGMYYWNNPRINGTLTIIGNESVFVMNNAWGYRYFMYKDELTKRDFLKGGDIIFLFSMQGMFCYFKELVKI